MKPILPPTATQEAATMTAMQRKVTRSFVMRAPKPIAVSSFKFNTFNFVE